MLRPTSQRLHRHLAALAGVAMIILMSGCGGSLLPQREKTTDSQWKEHADIQGAFDQIKPGETRLAELNELGFNPYQSPNIRIVDYLEITQRFLPNQSLSLGDLHPAVRDCLTAKTACRGYEVHPEVLNKDRYGSVLKDVFGFRKRTRTTGWRFNGLIVLNEDLVIYKIASSAPKILEVEDEKNPLGPFQSISINTGWDLQ